MFDRFTTDRLEVRLLATQLQDPHARHCVEAALAEALTPPVLAHLPDDLQLPANLKGRKLLIAGWVDARAAESDAFTLYADGWVIGVLMLFADPDESSTLHLGYLLAQNAWGKGYASELVAGLVAQLQGMGPLRLKGGVSVDNPASARVLLKSGFRLSPDDAMPGTDIFVLNIQ